MPRSTRRWPSELRGVGWPPWLTLAGSLLLTAAATAFMTVSYRDRDDARFENRVQSATDLIRQRLEVYLSTLRGTAALIATSEEVTAEEFREYIEHLDIQRRHPGIQGIGWSARRERGPHGAVDEQHEIVYLEPLDERNRAALGFDMYSEATRRAAMQRARDRGVPVMSGRVTLVQEIMGPEQAGFLIYVPVYDTDQVPATVAARRNALVGFAYSPFRAGDLFTGIFGSEEAPRIAFSVYDGTTPATNTLLYASPRPADHEPSYTATVPLVIAGHRWTVRLSSLPTFEADSLQALIPPFAIGGVLFSLLLFGFVASVSRSRFVAEEANRAKSAFLATMSHELRTPLNAVLGYVDLLDLGIPDRLTEGSRAHVERIRRGARHLLHIIEGILTFSRLEGRSETLSFETVDLPELVESTLEMIRPLAERKGVTLSADLEGAPEEVTTDSQRLKQILLNLLGNAVKFTDVGAVELLAVQEDGALTLTVRDSGVGIAPQHLDRIFDPFWQVDQSHTREAEGTGLGLTVSRELARLMGGDITVTSRPEHGSSFRLTLPLRHPAAVGDAAA